MSLVLTLLTLFLGGEPGAAVVPPEPAKTTGTVTIQAEFETTVPAQDYLGLPTMASPACPMSPSWMVASPPRMPAPFDVFSPAVRPPQEFPTLFPCDPVALVPCPAPTPVFESPAVRHVGFHGEEAEVHIADREPRRQEFHLPRWTHPMPFPAPMAFAPPGFVPDPMFHMMAEQAHARRHAPQHHQVSSCEEAQACPLCSEAVCPLGFDGHMIAEGVPFLPGAKRVQHVVRATYETGPEAAKALRPFLEGSSGVFGYQIDGGEITINATAPTQMAIATFLATVVDQPRPVKGPQKALNVKHTKIQACPGECAEGKHIKIQTKACASECAATKSCDQPAIAIHVPVLECGSECVSTKCCDGKCECKGQCKCDCDCNGQCDCNGKCQCKCCCGKKTTPKASGPSVKRSLSDVFSFYVGLQDCQTCPSAKTAAKTVQVKAQERKPVTVRIRATSEGVLLETSEGTQIRADEIQLETNGIQKLRVQQTREVKTSSEKKCNPNCSSESAALNADADAGFFQLGGPYSAVSEQEDYISGFRRRCAATGSRPVSESENRFRGFRFGGVELNR